MPHRSTKFRPCRQKKIKREVEWNGEFYKVRSDRIEIPELKNLPRFEALTWLISHTYMKNTGKSKPWGLADVIGPRTN